MSQGNWVAASYKLIGFVFSFILYSIWGIAVVIFWHVMLDMLVSNGVTS